MVQADFRNQALKSLAPFRCRARLPQVLINHEHSSFRPTQGLCSLSETVLQPGGFLMIEGLLHSGLPDIDDGQTVQVPGADFAAIESPFLTDGIQTHNRPPPSLLSRSVGVPTAG